MAAFAYHMPRLGFSSISRSSLRDSSPWCKSRRIIKMSMNLPSHNKMGVDHEVQTRIQEALLKLGGQHCVMQPMHHLAFAASTGKWASLCIGACEMIGGRREDAIATASALHLMLSAAHVHENIPLSEQTKPTIDHAFAPNIELLTGDGLLPFGYQVLAEMGDGEEDESHLERVVKVITEISKAMGSQGMVEGQYIQQLKHMEEYRMREEEWVYQVSEKKEGGLYACSAACGAILGGATEKETNQLRRYGFYLGMMDGMMTRGVRLLEEQKLHQLIQGFQRLALQELENFQDRNADSIQSLMDGYSPNNQTTRKFLMRANLDEGYEGPIKYCHVYEFTSTPDRVLAGTPSFTHMAFFDWALTALIKIRPHQKFTMYPQIRILRLAKKRESVCNLRFPATFPLHNGVVPSCDCNANN